MGLYKCDLCGRVFHERMPHVCTHGNYRKRNLFFTEFEDVDNEYIKKSDLDVKEDNFPNIPQGALILNEPLKSKIEHLVNWEQARIDAAIGAMTAMLASPELMQVVTNPTNVVEKSFESRVAKLSREYADALIAELKKEKNEQP